MFEVDFVGGDDHSACTDFITNLNGSQVRFSLRNAGHLFGDDAEPRGFELR